MTYTVNYPERRGFLPYDAKQYLLYLNEKKVKYVPETHTDMGDQEQETPAEKINGFSYTGTLQDGGTLITATEATYEAFTSGLIRTRYTQDEELALHANIVTALRNPENERAAEFTQRWEEFEKFRAECKEVAKEVLSR